MQKQLYKLFVELKYESLSAIVDTDEVLDRIVSANADGVDWMIVPAMTNKLAFKPSDVILVEVAEIDVDAYDKFGLVEVKDR